MGITITEAAEQIQNLGSHTVQEAKDIMTSVDAATGADRILLFWAGGVGGDGTSFGIPLKELAEQENEKFINKYTVIGDSAVGTLLESTVEGAADDYGLRAAIESSTDYDSSVLDVDEHLLGRNSAGERVINNSFWDVASKNVAAARNGDVEIYVAPNTDYDSTLYKYEVPELLDNGNDFKINGISKSSFSSNLQHAFDQIKFSSVDLMKSIDFGGIRVGELLGDNNHVQDLIGRIKNIPDIDMQPFLDKLNTPALKFLEGGLLLIPVGFLLLSADDARAAGNEELAELHEAEALGLVVDWVVEESGAIVGGTAALLLAGAIIGGPVTLLATGALLVAGYYGAKAAEALIAQLDAYGIIDIDEIKADLSAFINENWDEIVAALSGLPPGVALSVLKWALSFSDPHLVTFDGIAYDFQDRGEFTLVESTDEYMPFEVQARHEQWANSGGVAMNTAVATELGDTKVGIYLPNTLADAIVLKEISSIALDEFTVNTVTAGGQGGVAITELADGGFVIVWHGPDGSGVGVYGQRYNADGTANGDEFQLNTYTSQNQAYPTITGTADGGFVAMWQSYSQNGDYREGIFGQKFNADGSKNGDDFQVNSGSGWEQTVPVMDSFEDGGFVAAWTSNRQEGGTSLGIYAQKLHADGSKDGAEIHVNSYTGNNQFEPSLTALNDGGFVVTWTSYNQDGHSNGVFGQRFDVDGAVAGDEFQVNTYTYAQQHVSAVSALSDGGFVVTWVNSGGSSSANIHGQMFNADGTMNGDEFVAGSVSGVNLTKPAVEGLSTGGFVVTWTGTDANGSDAFGQKFNADGSKDGVEFSLQDNTVGEQSNTALANLSNGTFVATWTTQDLDASGIAARVIGEITDASEVITDPVYVEVGVPVVLSIDGQSVVIEDGELMAVGGGLIYRDGNEYTVITEYGDGFIATIGTIEGGNHINIAPFLSENREAGTVRGLLGNADGDSSNEFTLEDGTFLGTSISANSLYEAFGEELRVVDGESFFTYGEGEGVGSFNDPNFVNEYVTLNDFDPTLVAAARAQAIAAGFDETALIFDAVVMDFLLVGPIEKDSILEDIEQDTTIVQAVIENNPVADIVVGTTGDDSLTGTAEGEQIIGRAGNDTITSGAGADVILLTRETNASDVITDFETGVDVINLTHGSFDGLETLADLNITQDGADALVSLGDGHTIRLIGVDVTTLSADDFAGIIADNTAPIAVNDDITVDEDASVTFDIVANDTDEQDGSVVSNSVIISSNVVNGTLINNGDGTVTYTGAENFNGVDSFNYTVTDSEGVVSNAATVNITVDAVNDAPVAGDDVVSTDEDVAVTFDLLANDSDVEGALVGANITITAQPSNGTLVDNGDGTVTYTAEENYNGTDGFAYTITDAEGLVSQPAIVELTINTINDAPTLDKPLLDVDMLVDNMLVHRVPVNAFIDLEGDFLTLTATLEDGSALPTWLEFDAITRLFSGIPTSTGGLNIKVTADDGNGGTVSDVFTLQVASTLGEVIDGDYHHNNIEGTQGNDTIDGQGGNDTLLGLGGDDLLIGNNNNDQLFGGDGDDVFFVDGVSEGTDHVNGGAGVDSLIGGVNDDVFGLKGFGGDFSVEVIDGGAGVNIISGSYHHQTLDFTNTTLLNIVAIDGQGGNDKIIGSAGNDVIIGNAGNDTLYGGLGNDKFVVEGSSDGTDYVTGGDGIDSIVGGVNDDVISLRSFSGTQTVEVIDGGAGVNIVAGDYHHQTLDFTNTTLLNIAAIDGQGGNDQIIGSAGNDVIIGNAGNDTLYGGLGNDKFVVEGSSDGTDYVTGGDGIDSIVGGVNDDVISLRSFSGTQTVEVIDGGAGVNIVAGSYHHQTLDFTNTTLLNIAAIDGQGGNDQIIGSAGNDVIIGNAGNDTLYGGLGNDKFVVEGSSDGTDYVTGGDGIDSIVGGENDDVISLRSFSGTQTVEVIDGGAGVNIVAGDYHHQTLDFTNTTLLNIAAIDGQGGNDKIIGSVNDDVIIGNAGNDTLYGGLGNDKFVVEGSSDGTDYVTGGDGIDSIVGGVNDDVISLRSFSGTQTVEVIDGGAGVNIVAGDYHHQTLDFTNTTLINIAAIDGKGGNDQITGSANADTIMGNSGNDTLNGGAGDDFINGNEGNDKVLGNGGADILHGGQGNDIITGGAGADELHGDLGNDTFVIGVGDSTDVAFDVIVGFEQGADNINLTAFNYTSLADLTIAVGTDTVITDLNSDFKLVLTGTQSLTDADFSF